MARRFAWLNQFNLHSLILISAVQEYYEPGKKITIEKKKGLLPYMLIKGTIFHSKDENNVIKKFPKFQCFMRDLQTNDKEWNNIFERLVP